MSTRITSKRIGAAIYEKFGIDGVRVFGNGNIGCFHFYSDDDELGLRLATWPSTTVYVNAMNHLTMDQWLDNFELLFEEAEGREAVERAIDEAGEDQ